MEQLETEVELKCNCCGYNFKAYDETRRRCDDCRDEQIYGYDVYDRGKYG